MLSTIVVVSGAIMVGKGIIYIAAYIRLNLINQ